MIGGISRNLGQIFATEPFLQCKDIQLCYDMAKETRTPIEFLGRMQQIYHRAQYQVSLVKDGLIYRVTHFLTKTSR